MKKTIISVFIIALALTFVTPLPSAAKEENTQYCYREKPNTTTKSEGYRSKSKATTKSEGYRSKSKATTKSEGYRSKSKATTKNKGYRAKSKTPSSSTSKGKSSKKS